MDIWSDFVSIAAAHTGVAAVGDFLGTITVSENDGDGFTASWSTVILKGMKTEGLFG